jgi:4a-hydroxytetrahydrobiopterin dehydratase
MGPILTDAERAELSELVPSWQLAEDGKSIHRSFRFRDFSHAWGFMSRVALLAETHDHHPDWSNMGNRVVIVLTTHDADGLTRKDVTLALAIDGVLAS